MLSHVSHQLCYLLSTRARYMVEFYHNLLVTQTKKRTPYLRSGKFLASQYHLRGSIFHYHFSALVLRYIKDFCIQVYRSLWICKDLRLEPDMQHLTGDNLPGGNNTLNEVRAEVSALGLCRPFIRAIIGIRIFNPKAPRNWSKEISQMYACYENLKKRA